MDYAYELYLHRARRMLARRLLTGALCGGAAAIAIPYGTGIDHLSSLAAWGAVWGVLLAGSLALLRHAALAVVSTLYGAVFPTLIAWFMVAPVNALPIAADGDPSAMALTALANAAWGLTTGLGLVWFGGARSPLSPA
ncbi:MAG TPA: hypothetical protein VIV54_19035 [Burkholderiales bacterium]